MIIKSHKWYEYEEGNQILCGSCVIAELKKSKDGTYTGEEKWDEDEFSELKDDEGFQCDVCLTQSPEYDNLDLEP